MEKSNYPQLQREYLNIISTEKHKRGMKNAIDDDSLSARTKRNTESVDRERRGNGFYLRALPHSIPEIVEETKEKT